MKKIISIIFALVTMFTVQSCVGTYAAAQDDIYYSDNEYLSTDINVIIRYGTPYYYDGYLSYYFYNGWYYYPYFYNDYSYFRPYRHAFRPGYRPHIYHRRGDIMLREHRYGFSKPHNHHPGLPKPSDRRFGQRPSQHNYSIGPNKRPDQPRPRVERHRNGANPQMDINRQRDNRQRNIQTRPSVPQRSSSRPSMQNAPTRSSGNMGGNRLGRFGGRR